MYEISSHLGDESPPFRGVHGAPGAGGLEGAPGSGDSAVDISLETFQEKSVLFQGTFQGGGGHSIAPKTISVNAASASPQPPNEKSR